MHHLHSGKAYLNEAYRAYLTGVVRARDRRVWEWGGVGWGGGGDSNLARKGYYGKTLSTGFTVVGCAPLPPVPVCDGGGGGQCAGM